MDNEKINKLLRDFKFASFSLEKTITVILKMENIPVEVTGSKDHEPSITELANILVEYRFNYSSKPKHLIIQSLELWVKDNKNRLTSSYNNLKGWD